MQTQQRARRRVNWLEAPGLAVVFLVTQIPFVITIGLSFVQWNIRRPQIKPHFNGIQNYSYILGDSNFYHILLNTIAIVLLALSTGMIAAFVFSLVFNHSFRGVGVARAIFVMPYFVMEPVIGIIWKTLLLSPSFGISAVIARFFNLTPPSFFNADNALWTIVILCAWQWTPFLFLILLSGMQGIPEEIIEAARIDGAGKIRIISDIKIPLMMPYFKVAGMFGLINLMKVFGIIFVTTQGGPGISSANLPYYVYKTAFYDWQAGRAAAISVLMVVITLAITQVFFKLQGNTVRR